MIRFTSITGAAAICSMSLLFATSTKAYDDYQHYDGHIHHYDGHLHHDDGHHHGEGLPYPGLESETFGGMGHIDMLAENCRYMANHITFDMYYNYQHNPGFQEIYAKCYSFRNLSYIIHDMEHTGDHVEMSAAISEMDSLFHSLEHDLGNWRRTARLQVGQGDIHYKMELLEDMMHHLMNDAGVRSQAIIDNSAPPVPGNLSVDAVPPPPGVGPLPQ